MHSWPVSFFRLRSASRSPSPCRSQRSRRPHSSSSCTTCPASGRTLAPAATAASPPQPRPGHTAAAAPSCACGRATGPSPFRQTPRTAVGPPAPSDSRLVCSSFVHWSCSHLHRRHTLQVINQDLALKFFSLLKFFSVKIRSLHAPFPAPTRLPGRCCLRVRNCRQSRPATGAIHSVCTPRTQPQSAAPLAILELVLVFLASHPAHEVHVSLFEKKKNPQNKKTPWSRFLGPGLV